MKRKRKKQLDQQTSPTPSPLSSNRGIKVQNCTAKPHTLERNISIVIHKCNIQVHGGFLNFDPCNADTREALPEDVEVSLKNKDTKVRFTLLYGAISVSAFLLKDGRWKISRISSDFVRVAFNHSGRVLDNEPLFFRALTKYNDTLNSYITEESQDRCLPGIVNGGLTYWSSIEANIQIQDLDHSKFNMFRHASHTRVRQGRIIRTDTSFSIAGSETKFLIYFKDVHLDEVYHMHIPAEHRDVLRIECKLKKSALLRDMEAGTKQRVASFNLDDLYRALKKSAYGVRAVFFNEQKEVKLNKVEKFILDLAITGDFGAEGMPDIVKRYSFINNCSKETKARMLRNISSAFAATKGMDFNDLFPPTLGRSHQLQPQRQLRDKKGFHTNKVVDIPDNLSGTDINESIRRAYKRTSYILYDDFAYAFEQLNQPSPPSVENCTTPDDLDTSNSNNFPTPPRP